jgi:hypothetical protein
VLAMKAMIFSVGRLMPIVAALLSSSRMAISPMPSLDRRIHQVISSWSASRSTRV